MTFYYPSAFYIKVYLITMYVYGLLSWKIKASSWQSSGSVPENLFENLSESRLGGETECSEQ